jgi:hypothetical protein
MAVFLANRTHSMTSRRVRMLIMLPVSLKARNNPIMAKGSEKRV